jgi:hypothetical protein
MRSYRDIFCLLYNDTICWRNRQLNVQWHVIWAQANVENFFLLGFPWLNVLTGQKTAFVDSKTQNLFFFTEAINTDNGEAKTRNRTTEKMRNILLSNKIINNVTPLPSSKSSLYLISLPYPNNFIFQDLMTATKGSAVFWYDCVV